MKLARKLLLMSGGVAPINYLMRDEFTTPDAAPITSPRTGEPGPGGIVFTDASNIMSIADSRLIIAGTPAAQSGFIGDTAFARISGRAARFNYARLVNTGLHRIGWGTAMTSSMLGGGVLLTSTAVLQPLDGGNLAAPVIPDAIWIILRSTGHFLTSDSELLWVNNATTTSNVKPTLWISNGQTPDFDLDAVEVYDLGLDFEASITLHSSASPVSPVSATGQANGIAETTWTATALEVFQMAIRSQDANNEWRIKLDENANRTYLYEVVAGVETERGATGGIATTFDAASSYRLMVTYDGQNIRVYVDGVLKQNYATAANFLTATGVRISGFASASNFIVWKRDL